MTRFLRSELVLIAGISALGLILRLIQLDFQPLWWDEGYTVFFATRDLPTMLARTAIDIHPPLYYAALQLWTVLAGLSPVALRLFSVLVGTLAIPLVYFLGRRMFNPRVGAITGLLLAVSPLHIYYSQEVRMYGLVTLLSLASISVEWKLLTNEHEPTRVNLLGFEVPRRALTWFGYVLVTAAALYTQYFAAFVVAGEIAVAFYSGMLQKSETGTKFKLRSWAAAWFAMLVLLVPWVAYSAPRLYAYVSTKVGIEQYSSLDPFTFLAQHLVAFSTGHLTGLQWLSFATILFASLAGVGLALTRVQKAATISLSLWFFVPLLLGLLLNLIYPFHPIRYERLLLFLAPLFYLAVALGIDSLRRRRALWAYAATAASVLVSFASLTDFYSSPRYEKEDYRPLISEMRTTAQPGDAVLALYPWQIGYLASYYQGAPLRIVEVPADEWENKPAIMEKELAAIRANNERVWLLAYQTKGHRLEDRIANFFSDDYRFYDDWFENSRLEYFVRTSDPAIVEKNTNILPALDLVSYGAGPQEVYSGSGFVAVRLHWQTEADGYNYSLRLVDANGSARIQQDAPVPVGNQVDKRGVFVPARISPGVYDLVLLVYRRSDGIALPLGEGRNDLLLSRISVRPAQ